MGINLVISSLVLVIKYDLYMFLMGVRVHFYACTSMSIDMEGNELMQSVFRTGQSDSHVLFGISRSTPFPEDILTLLSYLSATTKVKHLQYHRKICN